MSYVYIQTEPKLWTVGFYRPDGKFETDSDYPDQERAAMRAAWLNGSFDVSNTKLYQKRVESLIAEGLTRSDAQAVADAELMQ